MRNFLAIPNFVSKSSYSMASPGNLRIGTMTAPFRAVLLLALLVYCRIAPAAEPAIVMLSDLVQTYDGTGKNVSATTIPAGLAVDLIYDGQTEAPTNSGVIPLWPSFPILITMAPARIR